MVSARVSQVMGSFCNRPKTEGKLLLAAQEPICMGKLIICSSLLRFFRQWKERGEKETMKLSRHRARLASDTRVVKTDHQSFPEQASPANGPAQRAALVLAEAGQ